MTVRRIEVEGTIALDDVSHVRRFVETLHRRVPMTDDDASRLAMVTHELLENAIKFSADGGASLRVEVDDAKVCITTRNRTRATDLAALKAVASTLVTSDPMAVYIGLMKRAPAARGGLGLGRVAAEGEMEIGLALDGDIVQVQARATLAPPPA
jgi:hypothetical protein